MKRTIEERLAHLKDTFDKAHDLEMTACKMFNEECEQCPYYDSNGEYDLFNTCCKNPNNDTSTCCVAQCPLRKE